MIKVTQRAGIALHSKGKEKCWQHVELVCMAAAALEFQD